MERRFSLCLRGLRVSSPPGPCRPRGAAAEESRARGPLARNGARCWVNASGPRGGKTSRAADYSYAREAIASRACLAKASCSSSARTPERSKRARSKDRSRDHSTSGGSSGAEPSGDGSGQRGGSRGRSNHRSNHRSTNRSRRRQRSTRARRRSRRAQPHSRPVRRRSTRARSRPARSTANSSDGTGRPERRCSRAPTRPHQTAHQRSGSSWGGFLTQSESERVRDTELGEVTQVVSSPVAPLLRLAERFRFRSGVGKWPTLTTVTIGS